MYVDHKDSTDTTAAPPSFSAPERRSSMPVTSTPQPNTDANAGGNQQSTVPQAKPAPPAPTVTQQPAATVNDINLSTGPAYPGAGAGAGAGGRWSLLPMQFAKSGDPAHPPTRATQHAGSVMQAMHPPQPSVDQQRQASASRLVIPPRRPGSTQQ